MSEYEVRKMPKKTIIIIAILVVAGVVGAYFLSASKKSQVQYILAKVGYENVSDITVFGEHEFLNQETNVKGKQFSIKFTDMNNAKECRGFIFKDYKRNYMKDLECK